MQVRSRLCTDSAGNSPLDSDAGTSIVEKFLVFLIFLVFLVDEPARTVIPFV
jgi:hypothetical protein